VPKKLSTEVIHRFTIAATAPKDSGNLGSPFRLETRDFSGMQCDLVTGEAGPALDIPRHDFCFSSEDLTVCLPDRTRPPESMAVDGLNNLLSQFASNLPAAWFERRHESCVLSRLQSYGFKSDEDRQERGVGSLTFCLG
jgi:hypothetical protein